MNAPAVQNTLALVGRLLLAYLFLPSGLAKIGGFAGTVGMVASKGLPMPELATALVIAVEILGGLALVLGWGTRWASLALALFTLVAGLLYHNWWAMPQEAQMLQKIIFDEHLAVIGGLLVLAAFGPGAYSVEGRRGTVQPR
ncbi:DoxX family protein [Melaminivora suipulveris]|uniref:DoxX family protein n=1 Tax=Melaminivora suipulveris TaxID=2109913 RepID=A0A2R3Q8V1_9BURK|nr:DoxX family protein [Melaminivora suipulveris]AVO48104.1 DoxX family protein [Melaminivora suipulveris]